MFKLRDYQIELSNNCLKILANKGFVYLSAEVRIGKSFIVLNTANLYGAKKVLFITKIKAFSSIQSDYDTLKPSFELTIINKESIHKIPTNDYDLIICDEAHGLFGTFPKPNNFTKIYKKRFAKIPAILLSGTMSPESYSQLFHQFWINDFSPFRNFTNFYKWAAHFVIIKKKYLGYAEVNDYSDANQEKIMEVIQDHVITFTQKEAGFTTEVKENFIIVEMKPITYQICAKLKKENVVQGKNDLIIADTGAKLMNKLHQLYSGTIITESGNTIIIDKSKAEAVRDKFQGKKIGIFYKFKGEYTLLKEVFGDLLTNDLAEFDNSNKSIALQYVSGREGISLKKADYLVFFNPDYSAVSYFQARDRCTTIDRKSNEMFWVFAKNGIENHIYKAIVNKKNFTLSTFKKIYGIKNTKQHHKVC